MSDKMNELMAQLSQKLNMSPEKVQSAAEKGDVDSLLQNSDCDNAQVREILVVCLKCRTRSIRY